MPAAMKAGSLWWAVVEDLAMWSSPASATHAAVLGRAGIVGVLQDVAASGRRPGPCRTTCRTRRRTAAPG